MKKRPTWGIIGAGHIAYQIADALIELNAQIRGVAARTQASAQKFAARYPGCRATRDVQQLLNDSDLDVVYIASPNHLHLPHALAAINHGKGVLIEKPFALDSIEAEQIIAAARRAKVFCMEAMWTRFIRPLARLKRNWTPVLSGLSLDLKQASATEPHHFKALGSMIEKWVAAQYST